MRRWSVPAAFIPPVHPPLRGEYLHINNIEDFYSGIESLIVELRAAGEEAWSSALDRAMSISSASGEVLGELKLQLKRLKASRVPEGLNLKSQVDEALSYLDRIGV